MVHMLHAKETESYGFVVKFHDSISQVNQSGRPYNSITHGSFDLSVYTSRPSLLDLSSMLLITPTTKDSFVNPSSISVC